MRKKLKAPKYSPAKQKVYDRTTTDIPFNARVAVAEIEDPSPFREFASPALARRKTGELTGVETTELRAEMPARLRVVRSLRDDPLASMHARGWVDDVQFEAGRKWQFAHMRSEIGVVKAIDPSKEAVDGGMMMEPDERVSAALLDMARAKKELRKDHEINDRLVRKILGEGRTIAQAADAFGLFEPYERRILGKQFRMCLDILAFVFGCATRRAA